jgi:hypothetical protein
MSDYSKECLVHYDNRHLQVRQDFFCLCAYNKDQYNKRLNEKGNTIRDEPDQECMAKILRLLETLTNAEKARWSIDAMNMKSQGLTPAPEPTEYPIMLSYEALYQLMYGTHGDNIIRNSVAVLLERTYICRVQETNNSIPTYTLQCHIIQPLLKEQHDHPKVAVKNNTRKRRVLKITPPITPVLGVENKQVGVENKQHSPKVGVENNTNNIVSPLDKKRGEEEGIDPPAQENSSSSVFTKEETILTQYDEKERGTISLVVKKLDLPLTDTLASTIVTTSRRYKQFDWKKATKEMLEYFQANKKGKVMTETWFDSDLARKIGFYQKDIHETTMQPEPSKPRPPVSPSLQQYIDLQQRYMQQAHV